MSTDTRTNEKATADYRLTYLRSSAYDLLSELTSECDQGDYTQALRGILGATRLSEERGFPITSFPLLICQLIGANPEQAVPIAAAWRALHIAAKMLDDVEDGDLAASEGSYGCQEDTVAETARVINLSTGFIAIAGLALKHLPPSIYQELTWHFNITTLRMAAGQHLDLGRADELSLEECFRIMEAKTGSFFALAARASGVCARAATEDILRLEEIGSSVGMMIQLMDDLVDWQVTTRGKGEDLARGHHTLPVWYGLSVASPSVRADLRTLLWNSRRGDDSSGSKARDIIETLGGAFYVRVEIEYYMNRTLAALDSDSYTPEGIEGLRHWLKKLAYPGA